MLCILIYLYIYNILLIYRILRLVEKYFYFKTNIREIFKAILLFESYRMYLPESLLKSNSRIPFELFLASSKSCKKPRNPSKNHFELLMLTTS